MANSAAIFTHSRIEFRGKKANIVAGHRTITVKSRFYGQSILTSERIISYWKHFHNFNAEVSEIWKFFEWTLLRFYDK